MQSEFAVLHHRGERSSVAIFSIGLESDRIPPGLHRCETRTRTQAPGVEEQCHWYASSGKILFPKCYFRRNHCLLRTIPRLLRREVPQMGPRKILQSQHSGMEMRKMFHLLCKLVQISDF